MLKKIQHIKVYIKHVKAWLDGSLLTTWNNIFKS
jgi:hypothetical protein